MAPNPYVGPKPFQEGQMLHGRSREVMDLIDLLVDQRFAGRSWNELAEELNTGADALRKRMFFLREPGGRDVGTMRSSIDGKGSHGGYCGPAVKPIALNMVAEIARTAETSDIPISGIGGVTDWRDAVDFLALGASNVQVCTAAMRFGFKIIDDMVDGLGNWMDDKGYETLDDFRGKAIPNVTDWQYLDLNYKTVAAIDQDKCIECGLCSYVCVSRIPIYQYIKLAKYELSRITSAEEMNEQ